MANITSLVAMAVFLSFMTSNKNIQMFLPVSMLFVTDVIIGIYSNMWLTYGLMGVIGVISRVLHDGK